MKVFVVLPMKFKGFYAPPGDIENQESWDYMRANSLKQGGAPGKWTSYPHGFMLMDPSWTRSQASLYADRWNRDLEEMEISDELVDRLGIGRAGLAKSSRALPETNGEAGQDANT